MKSIVSVCFIALITPLLVEAANVRAIINQARATVGSEKVLDGAVTLQMSGWIEPAESKVPSAKILIISRRPCSQRLEVRVDDLVETTLLNSQDGCIIRSNLNDSQQRSQIRPMTDEEIQRAAFSTRQLFSFYEPDFKRGEQVTHQGIEQRRGVRCHRLLYSYPDGISTTRFFAVNDDMLISTVTDKGVESVELGEQVVQGIKFPKRVEYYEGDTMLHTVVIREIEVNKPLPRGIFTIPTGQKVK